MDQDQLYKSLCRMNQIRYYQLRMMECPLESQERAVYRNQIRDLQHQNTIIPSSVGGQ